MTYIQKFLKYWLVFFVVTNIAMTVMTSYIMPQDLEAFILNDYIKSITYYWCSVNVQHALINAVALLVLMDYYKDAEYIPTLLLVIVSVLTGVIHYDLFPHLPIVGSSAGILGIYGFTMATELWIDFKKSIYVHGIIMIIFLYTSYLFTKYGTMVVSHEAHIIGFILGVLIFAFWNLIYYLTLSKK